MDPNNPTVCRILNPPNDLELERKTIASVRRTLNLKEKRKRKKPVQKKVSKKSKRETPWEWLLKKLEYTFNNHVPFADYDNDTFSTLQEFRGYSWRGRDCNDFDGNIRPGVNSTGKVMRLYLYGIILFYFFCGC